MPTLKLDILIIPKYDKKLLTILDVSTYVTQTIYPTIEICIPGWDTVILPFTDTTYNIFNSTTLGITTEGNEQDLFDGIYYFKTIYRIGFACFSPLNHPKTALSFNSYEILNS